MEDLDCPSVDQWKAFLFGEVSNDLGESLRQHLEACSRCEVVAQELDQLEDPILEAVRRGAAVTVDLSGATDGHARPESTPDVEKPAKLPEQLGGYTILAELGRGGMGVVYKAKHLQLGRVVALKMILSGAHARPTDLARFQTEAEAIARLQHPNIVQVHEVGEHEGKPFFSLEFCAGGSLDQKLKGTPLPPVDAARLLETLARAMQAAHEKNVIHRDLKPANVLLAENGTPKITDFGLAKKLDDAGQTVSGAIMGTPSYMAPEQAGGKTRELGPACDVYALGAILYELLTGRPPFKAATAMETVKQVVSDEPVPPSQLQPKTPRDVETICLKCLHKEPGKRYATAANLAEDLRRFQVGEPIKARPVGGMERTVKWVRRNPALAAVGLVLFVATTVSAYFAADASQQTTQARIDKEAANRTGRELEKSNAELLQSQEGLRKSNDLLVTSTARGLMRLLGTQVQLNGTLPPLSDPEIDALWQLASSEDERLGVRFVEQALRGPVTTRQLKDRARYALHAAVRLDSARRTRVEELLGKCLGAEGITPGQREHVALVLAHFEIEDSALAGRVGQVLTEAMTRTTNPYALEELAQGLSGVAGRMEPKEAATVCGRAVVSISLAMTRTTKSDAAWRQLPQGLSALAARIEPKEAAEAAASLTMAMTKTTNLDALEALARSLSALAARMKPKEAAAVCGRATASLRLAVTKTTDSNALRHLAEGLSALAARMEPKEAAESAASIQLAMSKTTEQYAWHFMVPGLSALAARMEPKEAAESAASIQLAMSQLAMSKTTDLYALHFMAEGLSALAARMEPKEATAVCGQAAASIRLTMSKTTDPIALLLLARGLPALAARIEPKEAAESAAFIQLAMSKTTEPGALGQLAEGLSALAARMEPKEATAVCGQAAASIRLAVTKTTDANALGYLARGLSALAARMEPKEAAESAASIQLAMSKTTDPYALYVLAEGLSALAARMEPKEATAVCGQAAASIRLTMTKTTDPSALHVLAEGLSALAARMEPKEAAAVCGQAAASIRLTMTMTKTTDPFARFALQYLAQGLLALAARVESKEAAASREQAATAICLAMSSKTTVPDASQRQAQMLSMVLLREDSSRLKQRGQGVAGVIGPLSSRPESILVAGVLLQPALEPLPPPLPAQTLVDLLKHPFYVGEAQRVVLDQLARHYNHSFGDQWDFVRFAREQNLDLDLTSPPRRPDPVRR
jgi:Protein kinase domain